MGVYSTIKETIKDAVTVAQQSDNADLYRKVLDAYNAAMELLEENLDLKEKIKNLEEQKLTNESLFFYHDAYWMKNGEKQEGPFCSKCWDDNRTLIHLLNDRITHTRYECPKCKFNIQKWTK